MKKRVSSPPPTGLGGDRPGSAPDSANTTMAQGKTPHRAPRMPHERDESADQQERMEPSNRRVGERAHADAARGVPDTTQGAELDAAYDKLREDLPDGEKKRPGPVNRARTGASRR